MKYWLFGFFIFSIGICFSQKMGGVNLESPQKQTNHDYIQPVKRIATNWIAIVPFAFMNSDKIFG